MTILIVDVKAKRPFCQLLAQCFNCDAKFKATDIKWRKVREFYGTQS